MAEELATTAPLLLLLLPLLLQLFDSCSRASLKLQTRVGGGVRSGAGGGGGLMENIWSSFRQNRNFIVIEECLHKGTLLDSAGVPRGENPPCDVELKEKQVKLPPCCPLHLVTGRPLPAETDPGIFFFYWVDINTHVGNK